MEQINTDSMGRSKTNIRWLMPIVHNYEFYSFAYLSLFIIYSSYVDKSFFLWYDSVFSHNNKGCAFTVSFWCYIFINITADFIHFSISSIVYLLFMDYFHCCHFFNICVFFHHFWNMQIHFGTKHTCRLALGLLSFTFCF